MRNGLALTTRAAESDDDEVAESCVRERVQGRARRRQDTFSGLLELLLDQHDGRILFLGREGVAPLVNAHADVGAGSLCRGTKQHGKCDDSKNLTAHRSLPGRPPGGAAALTR